VRFEPTELGPEELALQTKVRAFLETHLARGTFTPGLGMSAPKDPAFSRLLAEQGWLGMALPARYGGGDRGAVDRFVVVEELLRWGAPVGHHWTAERQTGPVINRFGTDAQKERFLPGICRGELSFSIGMSEPDAGSDLASVKTRATKAEGGWLLNGTKIWTSGAHENDWIVVLCRTGAEEDRHEGLSQLLVDLQSEGVQANPIPFLDGTHHFNELVLTDVFVPDELVLGSVGMGWAQNTSELAFERGGPDRWISTYLVVELFVRERVGAAPAVSVVELIGDVTARWWGLRQLSLSVARLIDQGQAPSIESATEKEMGTRFEQEVLERLVDLVEDEMLLDPPSDSLFDRLLTTARLTTPAVTIRGGTIEILRTVVARGLRAATGAATSRSHDDSDRRLLADSAGRLFAETCTHAALEAAEAERWAPAVWSAVTEAGFPWISLPESAAGGGGSLEDELEVVRLAGYYAAPVPLAETQLAAWLLAGAGLAVPQGPATVVNAARAPALTVGSAGSGGALTIDGTVERVPWAEAAGRIAILAEVDGRWMVAAVPVAAADVVPGANLAGEPRDTVRFSRVTCDEVGVAAPGVTGDTLFLRSALARATLIAGAIRRASDVTVEYTNERRQFGQPVARFQAVQQHLVHGAQDAALVGMAVAIATRETARGAGAFEIAAAKLLANRGASTAARAAHQAHGAMGMTREYPLHHSTRRLWAWRHEAGSAGEWAQRVGRAALAVGPDRIYPLISGGSAELGDVAV
jgi:alkylation response protein AidB-like acyl-CoA dehydrogenase